MVGFLIGFARFNLVDTHLDQEFVFYKGGQVSVEGTISKDPEERLGRVEYVVDDVVFTDADILFPQKILVRGERIPKFSYGDRVLWQGTLEFPEKFTTDTGRIFDYENYLKKDGITLVLSFARGTYVEEGNRNFIKSILYNIKHSYIEHIDRVVRVPESILVAGLLLGERGSFSNELTNDFRRVGLIHIVVLSGYNIAIISEYTLAVLRKKLRKNVALLCAALFIVLFALMVGGGATVVRASIMGLLVLLARSGSRRYNITRALTFALLLMIIWNPLVLLYDVSFHLSFLATVALIYVAPLVEKFFIKVPEKFGIREVVVATISTQIFVLPYLIYRMGEVSLIAPIVNVLVLPVIPLTMLFAFLVGFTGVFSTFISYIFSFVLTPLLSYIIFMTEFFAKLPLASIVLPEVSFICVLIMYGILLYGIWYIKQKPLLVSTKDKVETFEVIEYQIIKAGRADP